MKHGRRNLKTKQNTKTTRHPAFFFPFFCNKCSFSCMSNADMERGGGGGCWGDRRRRRRRIHRRLNLLLSSAVIEQNKDRTQYRVLTPQHSRNESNHYTCHCKHGVNKGAGGTEGRGGGEGHRRCRYTRSECVCVSVCVCACVNKSGEKGERKKEMRSLRVCVFMRRHCNHCSRRYN